MEAVRVVMYLAGVHEARLRVTRQLLPLRSVPKALT